MTAAFSGLRAGWVAAPWPSWPPAPLVSMVMSVHALGHVRAVVAGDGVAGGGPDAEQTLRLGDDLGDAERLAPHPVIADRIDEVPGPHEHQQLARYLIDAV